MKLQIKRVLSLIGVIVLLINLYGCHKRETSLNAGFEEFEMTIYDDLGDCLRLNAPIYDENHKLVSIEVVFLDAYLKNETIIGEHPEYEIIDSFMMDFNQFIAANPDYFFGEDNNIFIEFVEDKGDHFEYVAQLSNYIGNTKEDYLCSVHFYLSVDYSKLACKDYIKFINVEYGNTENAEEYVCEVLSLFPNLQCYSCYDPDDKIKEAVSEEYPDLKYGI